MPEISVIIPTLNEEKFLSKTLEGLSKQTFRDFEIIIVDGYSTDRTVEIAKKFGARIIQTRKKGVSVARNIGARAARGKIIAMTDADVNYLTDWLEQIHKNFVVRKVDMVWGPNYWIDPPLFVGILHELAALWNINFSNKLLLVCNTNIAFSKTGFLKIGGYREDLQLLDDYDIGIRSLNHLKVYFDARNITHSSARRVATLRLFLKLVKNYARAYIQYHMKGTTDVVQHPVRSSK